jgi:hypothetical protein
VSGRYSFETGTLPDVVYYFICTVTLLSAHFCKIRPRLEWKPFYTDTIFAYLFAFRFSISTPRAKLDAVRHWKPEASRRKNPKNLISILTKHKHRHTNPDPPQGPLPRNLSPSLHCTSLECLPFVGSIAKYFEKSIPPHLSNIEIFLTSTPVRPYRRNQQHTRPSHSIMHQLKLTRSLILNEVQLQSFLKRIFIDIILHSHPATRKNRIS